VKLGLLYMCMKLTTELHLNDIFFSDPVCGIYNKIGRCYLYTRPTRDIPGHVYVVQELLIILFYLEVKLKLKVKLKVKLSLCFN
jgi:hypothetical protein